MNVTGNVQVNGAEGAKFPHMEVDLKSVPRLFDPYRLCDYDIIAFVRSKDHYPNPNQIVILDVPGQPVDKNELSGNKIFFSGPHGNDNDASIYSGLANVFLPVPMSDLDEDKEDCGIDEIRSSLATDYNLDEFGILLCGTKAETALMMKVYRYMQNNGNNACIVPYFVMEELVKDDHAIDIKPIIKQLQDLDEANNLNHRTLMAAMDKIGADIERAKKNGEEVRIACSLSSHDKLTRNILLYLSFHYNLSPKYVESYVNSYVDGHVAYDHKRMSLYERFMWVRNLPKRFGMFGQSLRLYCFCTQVDNGMFLPETTASSEELALSEQFNMKMSKDIASHIYPAPLYVTYVNRETGNTIVFSPKDEDPTGDAALNERLRPVLNLLDYVNYADVLPLMDFRSTFPGSSQFFTEEEPLPRDAAKLATLDSPGARDAERDLYWCGIFIRIAQTVQDKYHEVITPTVKNSVICRLSETELLMLYCPGSIGLNCMLSSEYFNNDIQLVGEECFHRFVDIRTLLALMVKDSDLDTSKEEMEKLRFAEIMKHEEKNLTPWMSSEVILVLNTLRPRNSGLSYYDRMLRSTVNVMPIVTDKDNPLYERSPLEGKFTFLDLMSADQSNEPLTTLTCFGTLADDISNIPVLQTTLESYRGCELL